MSLSEDQVVWGTALMLLKRHGERAPLKVAERIGELAIEGDDLGVALWTDIARCMNELISRTSIQ